ncbi:UNVERIFIED_CONTAM: hypothetical protein DES50_102710 [Williamsia faeni]
MDQEINFLTFATEDLDAVRRFYRDGLGWTPLLDVPGEIIFFQIAPRMTLGFFDSDKFVDDLGDELPADLRSRSARGVTLAHNVSGRTEVEDLMAAMARAGGRVLKSARDSAFGGTFHGHVLDPNNLIWEIAHNPGWQVDADGNVSFG